MKDNNRNIPKVAIIILTFNARSTLSNILDEAITSALSQDYPDIEVLVVDNNSSDDTYDYVKAYYGDKVKVIKLNRNYGYCLGNNLALKYVSKDAKYILFQNSDVILERDYVRKLVEILESDPKIAAIQGLEVQPFKRCYRAGGLLNTAGCYYFVEIYDINRLSLSLEVLLAIGAALLVRRKIFEAIGGFPSNYFLYFDDTDLCLRLRALGFRVIATTATKYYHIMSGTASKLQGFNLIAEYFARRNRLLTILKYFHGLYLVKALLLNIMMFIARFIMGPAVRRRIILKVISSILKELRHVLQIRKQYISSVRKNHILCRFLVPWHIQYIKSKIEEVNEFDETP